MGTRSQISNHEKFSFQSDAGNDSRSRIMAKSINDMDLIKSNTLRAPMDIAEGTVMNYIDELPDDLLKIIDITDKLSKQYRWTPWILGHAFSKIFENWEKYAPEKIYEFKNMNKKIFCREVLKKSQQTVDEYIHLYKTFN